MKYRFLLLMIICCITSCSRDNAIYFNDITMASIKNGQIITDQGLIYNVTKNDTTNEYLNNKRILIHCDILRRVSNKKYDIRLKKYSTVLFKKVLLQSETNTLKLGKDTIFIHQTWTAGDFLNFALIIPFHPTNKPQKHIINLVFNDKKSNKDSLFFHLYHKAEKDHVSKEEILNNKDIVYSLFYFSVKYNNLLKKEMPSPFFSVNN